MTSIDNVVPIDEMLADLRRNINSPDFNKSVGYLVRGVDLFHSRFQSVSETEKILERFFDFYVGINLEDNQRPCLLLGIERKHWSGIDGKKPEWLDVIRVILPGDDTKRCHLRITLNDAGHSPQCLRDADQNPRVQERVALV